MPEQPVVATKRRWASPKKIIILVLILAVLAGIIAFGLTHKSTIHRLPSTGSTKPAAAVDYSFTYSDLKSYSLSGAAAGQGMSFRAPSQFQVLGKAANDQLNLIHFPTIHQVPDYGRITAVSVKAPNATGLVKPYSAAISNISSKAWLLDSKVLFDFINENLPINYKSNLKIPTAFTNPQIKSGAWAGDFTADSSSNHQTIQGKVIIIFGSQAVYYFMAENVTAIWQANQSTWQQVTSSLEINQ